MLIEANLVFAFDVIDALGKPLSISDKVSRYVSIFCWRYDAAKLLEDYIEAETKFGWLASKTLTKAAIIEASYTGRNGKTHVLMEDSVEVEGMANAVANEISPSAVSDLLDVLSLNYLGREIINPFRTPDGKHPCSPEKYGFCYAILGYMFKPLGEGKSLFICPDGFPKDAKPNMPLSEKNACVSLHFEDRNAYVVKAALSFLIYADQNRNDLNMASCHQRNDCAVAL